MIKTFYVYLTAVTISVCVMGCGTKPSENGNVTNRQQTSSAATPAATPTRPPAAIDGGVAIEKEERLSFSTYDTNFPAGWQFIDPDDGAEPTKFDVKTGVLRLVVPSGKDLFGDNMTAPRYVKAIKGDFQIDTKVRSTPSENYQGAGLLIFNNKNNYVRLERSFGGTGGGGSGIRLDVRNNDEYTSISTPDDIPFAGKEVELRLIKNGGKIMAFWRPDENAEWREAGTTELPVADTVLGGLIACNTATEFEAKFVNITIGPFAPAK